MASDAMVPAATRGDGAVASGIAGTVTTDESGAAVTAAADNDVGEFGVTAGLQAAAAPTRTNVTKLDNQDRRRDDDI